MEHTRLGTTGLEVSRLCLGTMTFGLQCDEETSRRILDKAADAGVTFLDTADVYPLGGGLEAVGRTEEILGRWLAGHREDFVVATKCVGATGRHPWDRGASRKHVLAAADASLRRLGTDYLDLYQLHAPDPDTPIEESLGALEDLVRAGKVRYAGCSNFPAWRLTLALGAARAGAGVRFASVQPRYNLLFRMIERELLPLCAAEGVAVIPYNPLAGGLLSGRHDRSAPPPPGSRFALGGAGVLYQERYWHDEQFDTVAALAALATEIGVALPTLALAWVLAQPSVTSPIIGASRPEQLDATLAAVELAVPPEVLARLDDLTRGYRAVDAER